VSRPPTQLSLSHDWRTKEERRGEDSAVNASGRSSMSVTRGLTPFLDLHRFPRLTATGVGGGVERQRQDWLWWRWPLVFKSLGEAGLDGPRHWIRMSYLPSLLPHSLNKYTLLKLGYILILVKSNLINFE
jgi:hypothetical protein